MADKKFYWLRLHRDFFKRHDIQIVESMPNGKDYILFYLKLLVESVDHEGALRFSDTIPYSDDMLATVTRTNVDIVRSALKIFTELGMISILDDNTIFMEEVDKMIGAAVQDEHTRESTRLRVQKHREKKALECKESLQSRYSNATCNGEIEIEKEIEIDKDISKSTRVDYQGVVDKYNSICVSFKKVNKLSEDRKKVIKARLNTYTVDDLVAAFQKAESSDFLKGKNDKNWMADFDWMLKDRNLAKILDGNYDNKPGFKKATKNSFNDFSLRQNYEGLDLEHWGE